MSTITGECMFCGQTAIIDHTEDEWLELIKKYNQKPQTMANEYATRTCNCQKGQAWRDMKDALEICGRNIELMFEENFPEVAEILKEAMPLVYGAKILRKVSVTIGDDQGIATLAYGKTGLEVEHKKVLQTKLTTGR